MAKSAPIAVFLLLAAAYAPLTAEAITVFTENFNDGTVDPAITGTSALTVDTAPSGEQFLGRDDGTNNTEPTNRGLGNDTVTVSLAGLAAHSQATLNFSLYVINSMDGSEPFTVSETTAGLLLAATCSNVFGTVQCNLTTPATGPESPDATDTLGFSLLNSGVTAADATYNFSLTFAHSAPTLSAAFTYSGLQDIPDESWGLDNIVIATNADTGGRVPEPGTLSLLGLGLLGFGGAAVRTLRRRA